MTDNEQNQGLFDQSWSLAVQITYLLMETRVPDIPVLLIGWLVVLWVVLGSRLHLVIVTAIVVDILVRVVCVCFRILQNTISTTCMMLLFLAKSVLPVNKMNKSQLLNIKYDQSLYEFNISVFKHAQSILNPLI